MGETTGQEKECTRRDFCDVRSSDRESADDHHSNLPPSPRKRACSRRLEKMEGRDYWMVRPRS